MFLLLPVPASTERKLWHTGPWERHSAVSAQRWASTRAPAHTTTHTHQHTDTNTHKHQHTHQHTHTSIYISTHTPARTHQHLHISAHAPAHMHQHTRTQLQNSGLSIQSPYNDPWLVGLLVVSESVASGLFTPVKTQTSWGPVWSANRSLEGRAATSLEHRGWVLIRVNWDERGLD